MAAVVAKRFQQGVIIDAGKCPGYRDCGDVANVIILQERSEIVGEVQGEARIRRYHRVQAEIANSVK